MEQTQFLKRVLHWWWLVLLCTGVAAAGSYYVSARQPSIYQTTTTLMVGQVMLKANPTDQDFYTVQQLAESYAQMAVRQPILQATVDSLGLDLHWQALGARVYTYPIPRTQLLAIGVKDNSPKRAVAMADEIAHQLILQSPSSPENSARQERSEFVQSQLDDLELRIKTSQARIKELQAELDTAVSARQIQDLQTEIAGLEQLVNNWQVNYTNLLDFLQGGDTPNFLTVIEPAQLPTVPVSPDVKMNVLLAAAVGFVLAAAAALVLENLDDTLKAGEDLSASLGMTLLGTMSRIKGKDYKGKLITSHSSFSPVAEAYRLVRTNIQFMSVDQPIKSMLVTSPEAQEGKSVTAANLGIIMAQANLKTIVVDADLRRPSLHKIFQVPNGAGLTDLIRSPDPELGNYLKDTGVENLQVITSGPLPPNSSEMLGSRRMAELIQRLEQLADILIFDSPPLLAVTDAAVLSSRVDGVILVTQANRTRRETARQAVMRLQQVGAHVLGATLNGVSGRNGSAHHYRYYTRSSHRDPAIPEAPAKRRVTSS